MNAKCASTYKPSLIEDSCRWLYAFLTVLIIPFAFLNLLLRGVQRNKAYSHRKFERFGYVAHAPKANGYLIHCVSVGEVVAASCLVKRIMQEEPDTQITITTTTPTGSARVRDIFGDAVHHFYLPYDLHLAMGGMIRRIKPKAVLITEVELWPNLIHACWKRDIPVMVINARMTDRSARRYAKIGKLFTPMLRKLSHVCAQGKRDYENYLMLGMPAAKITLTNNIKFDQVATAESIEKGFMGWSKADAPILVAGSTHELEEQVILDAMQTLWEREPRLRLILVPRHPERFTAVAKILDSNGISYVRTSQTKVLSDDTKVVLLDEMGKLNSAYSVASIAFVGGSIAKKGGHNALEPAAFSVPVLMGPNTYNNPVICHFLQARGALIIVNNTSSMVSQCQSWLNSPETMQKAGQAGYQVLLDNRGALDSTLACIHSCVVRK